MASSLGSLLAKMEHRLNSSHPVPVERTETAWLSCDPQKEPGEQESCSDHTHCETYHVIYHESMKAFAERLRKNGTAAKKFILYET